MMVDMSNDIYRKLWDVISHPCLDVNIGVDYLYFKLGDAWSYLKVLRKYHHFSTP